MDQTDVKIVNLLIENSRKNASEIAEQVQLSVTAVIERMKKLESSGIIKKYTTIVDQNLLGKDVFAIIMVSLDHPKYNENFIKLIVEHDQISECHYIAGDFDYLLKVITANTKRLERVLDDIKSIPGVSKTKTMIVLSTLKNEYSTVLKGKKELPHQEKKPRTNGGKK
ncbi:MAG: Lrp/AsnC family transcriptional regulator [Bacilli bacterium]|jgi:Lrp/AsnC family leucine-responsive transcriptional regulator|nr:Lrp/AsnC family transcriptional regulator [Bacilli bacterium]